MKAAVGHRPMAAFVISQKRGNRPELGGLQPFPLLLARASKWPSIIADAPEPPLALGVWLRKSTVEREMPRTSFDLPDGDEVEIETAEVVDLFEGENESETIVELDDGSEVTVVATKIEVIAELGLNPLDFFPSGEDHEFLDYNDEDAAE